MKTDRSAVNVHSNTRVLCLTVIFVAVLSVPAFSYEEDTHFLMTYVLCRSAGFTESEALTIAAVDQGMDDSKAVNAHDNGIPQIEEEWRWHALDRDGEMKAAGIIARRDELLKAALEEKDPRFRLIRLGIFFHYQQDTWAHRRHDEPNNLSRDAFTTFLTPLGHGPWGGKPDRPPLNPVAALMNLEDGIVYAVDVLRRAYERKPSPFLAEFVPEAGEVYHRWKDKRKGRFFNQIDITDARPGSASLFLKSLLFAQINAYQRSRDYNPFYAPKRTPDRADFETVRANLQEVCDRFKNQVGEITIPSREAKLEQGFTDMTTEGLLTLGGAGEDEKATRQ